MPTNFPQGVLIRRPRIADIKITSQFLIAIFKIRWHTTLAFLIIDVRPRGMLSIRLTLPDPYTILPDARITTLGNLGYLTQLGLLLF
jgi:hypothetical protein